MSGPCWLAGIPGAGRCDGARVRAHLIPQQLLKREFPNGAVWTEHGWKPATAAQKKALRACTDGSYRPLLSLLADSASWVWACGGPSGVGGHHGMLDYARTLRIPRYRLPERTEEFAQDLGLGWWLDRTYGSLEAAA